ncbi:MAG TPA: DUF2779 domain-containing protein [Syntrophomonadaceae bacterium]|nr:DUF2779 domain-containing protein [Syntrophomonadaceae bacterium]HPR94657.1 DUF2779 domain-containing protein [Syntrophomonadaceae bacterium]
MKPRYLTKSRFKLALECPAKLFYDGKTEYANQKIEDNFLLSLAEGGFQVGELAKCYISGGHDIRTLDYEEALHQTAELLKQDQVIIYEAAFRYKQHFIRADILVKNQNKIDLIEVKAKSYDPGRDGDFLTKKGGISSGWRSYLYDIAFQKHVVKHALPGHTVAAYLMMADKNALCPADGLNQMFKIVTSPNGRKSVSVSPRLSPSDLSDPILININVDRYCEMIYGDGFTDVNGLVDFDSYVDWLADNYRQDKKIICSPSGQCGSCEFRATAEEKSAGMKSGFKECWKDALGWTDEDFLEPTVFDLWNFRKRDQYVQEQRIKMTDLTEDDLNVKSDDQPGLSLSQRQWLQITKAREKDPAPWIDKENLAREMESWVYPLHFIDFETSAVAIPFNKGRRPYEGIAFQFSHHVVYQDGSVEHSGQYLNTAQGVFPNYQFLRALKNELEHDQGSIFRYAAHENTYLNMIYDQLQHDPNPIPDLKELCDFIESISRSGKNGTAQWLGPRNMIDMCELVKRHYYDPATNGSNSIKYVLPAILNSSDYLQEKYSRPIYGAAGGIVSLNYKDWVWIKYDAGGRVIDPYKLLPIMFQDISGKDFELLMSDSEALRDGGAAMTAYARMQFEEMSEYEREEISRALLQYCELDTMAMVMIYEGWREMLKT